MALSGSCTLLGRQKFYRSVVKNLCSPRNGTLALSSSTRIISRCISQADIDYVLNEGEPSPPEKKISKAMRAYLERAKEHDEFIKKEMKEYEIGKRHLANMMGENPETFTQKDVNEAIKYLFPSGLFEPKARPIMEEPSKMFPPKKAAEFDAQGRPFHSLFYTVHTNYYQALYDIVEEMEKLNKLQDAEIRKGLLPNESNKAALVQSNWLSKDELEKLLLEPIDDRKYDYFISSVERLANHPYSATALDTLMKYRKVREGLTQGLLVPPLEYNEQGRPYIEVKNCRRNTATANVKLWGNGSGLIKINGADITYFKRLYHREQNVSSTL